MKTTLLALVTILLGVGLGVGTASLRLGMSPWDRSKDESVQTEATPPTDDIPLPRVSVDKTTHDFGTLDLHGEGTHDFVFTNEGKASLKLSAGGTSCRCAVASVEQGVVPPGGSAKVTLTWKPTERPGPYEQTAKILTNDPDRRDVVLTVSGQITAASRFAPDELVFTQSPPGESATAESTLFCYLAEPLKVVSHEWSDASTAQHFDVVTEPLPADAVQKEPMAKSGQLVKVTVKAGLPQGKFQQDLTLKTNMTSSPAVTLPIRGSVGSDIAVAGRGWNPDQNMVNLGAVARDVGVERQLYLIVRGPLRKQIAFKPISVTPDSLHVSLGEPKEINNGTVLQVPLTIEIPKDSPPAVHLGSEQGPLGQILLETTHPSLPQLKILVRFAIEG